MPADNLERILVIVHTTMGTDQWNVELPIDIPAHSLVAKLVASPALPYYQNSADDSVRHRLMWKEGQRYLRESETLREAGVQPGHTLGVTNDAPARVPEPAEQTIERLNDMLAKMQLLFEMPDIGRRTEGSKQLSTVFVVHGRNSERKWELMRLLDRTLVKAEAIVLHEQINRGATILEKLERHAQEANFAVVLLTGDDEGRLRGDEDQPWRRRGRQNVIFELGIFIGLLGRSRVAVLKDLDLENPSDMQGLVYIPFDSAGAWRHTLLKEIDGAGIEVNFRRIP